MTCKHQDDDPTCSSYQAKIERAQRFLAKVCPTPDSENFEIDDALEVSGHLVLRVMYPNCKNCAYEGNKVMVFLNCGTKEALRWREIDPHFRDPSIVLSAKQAPPPAARFPASPAGWADAIAYAAQFPTAARK